MIITRTIIFVVFFIVAGAQNQPPGVELFFTAYGDGGFNRFLEIYNAGNQTADLSEFAFPNTANGVTAGKEGEHEFWNEFTDGKMLRPGGVYVVVHPRANETLLARANQTSSYLSDRNDGFAIVYGSEDNYTILDIIGTFEGDGGFGWSVCGVSRATNDHTLLRKKSVVKGNGGYWPLSAGTNAENCEWIVQNEDDWTVLDIWEKKVQLPSNSAGGSKGGSAKPDKLVPLTTTADADGLPDNSTPEEKPLGFSTTMPDSDTERWRQELVNLAHAQIEFMSVVLFSVALHALPGMLKD